MRSPDVTGAGITSRLAPGKLRASPVVNGHLEVVAIRQGKTSGCDVAIAWDVARYLRFTAPGGPTIAAGTVEQIPGTGTGICPGNTNVAATCSRGNRREAMLDAWWGERDILAR